MPGRPRGGQRGSVIYCPVGLERQGSKQCRAVRGGRGREEIGNWRGEGEVRGIGKRMVRTREEKIGELVERGRDRGSVVMRNIKEAWRGEESGIILALSRG